MLFLKFTKLNRLTNNLNLVCRFTNSGRHYGTAEKIEDVNNKSVKTEIQSNSSLERRVKQVQGLQEWNSFNFGDFASNRRSDKTEEKIWKRNDPLDRKSYFLLCEEIKSGQCNSNEIIPLVPSICVKHKDENYFVDNVLEEWVSLVNEKAQSIRTTDLSRSIFTLQQINLTTKGDVLKKLPWRQIEGLAEIFLKATGGYTSLG